MAYAYETGQGVEPDLVKAVEYYSRAAEAGEVNAIEALERLKNELMTPIKRSRAKTVAKSTKKADKKDASGDSEKPKTEK
jgi:TPR repeat protein